MNVIHPVVCSKCGEHTGYSHVSSDGSYVCGVCLSIKEPSKTAKVRLTKPQAKRVAAQNAIRPIAKIVSDFAPKGRSGLFIYAVVIRQHPEKVKIGMTRKWNVRRRAYACWDLSPGDALIDERCFCINEEFVDLERLEAHILQTFDAPLAFGAEWFSADIGDACRHIDRVMCANGISYSL